MYSCLYSFANSAISIQLCALASVANKTMISMPFNLPEKGIVYNLASHVFDVQKIGGQKATICGQHIVKRQKILYH